MKKTTETISLWTLLLMAIVFAYVFGWLEKDK
jgi:hypothetical protein